MKYIKGFALWFRDFYVIIMFLFVWFFTVYASGELYAHWHIGLISDHFDIVSLLVVVDGALTCWQLLDRGRNTWLVLALGVLSAIVLVMLILKNIVTVFVAPYSISFSLLVVLIIIVVSIEISLSNEKKEIRV